MKAGHQLDLPSQSDGAAMNETVVPTSARALGSIRHPPIGSKKHATVQKDLTRGVQSALHDSNGNSWTLNVGSTVADSKPSTRLVVSGSATSGPFSANSVSKHPPGVDLRWGHRNKDLSASQSKPSINQAINDVITGLQFHAINEGRNSFNQEDNFEDTQRGSSNGNGSLKSGKRRTVGGQSRITRMERGRAFVELNGQQKQKQRWPLSHNYLDDGDFVKGRGHRIDTGPMSRPVSGWMNRESRNAVELAEQDRGEGGLGRYYSLDVGTGAVTARQLTNGEGILIGVNGQERRGRRRQTSGLRFTEDDGGEDGEAGEEEEVEELASDAEELDRVNVESDEAPAEQFVPLCWDDQFMKAAIKVVKPRLPSAQTSSSTTTTANEPTPVVFWSRGSQQREANPPSVTKLQTPTKENYVSMSLQRKSGKKKKPQSVKFNEFRHRSARGAITSNIIDGDEDEERMEYSFRHGSLESRGTWSASVFPGAGSENPGSGMANLRMVNGRHGVDVHADMIVVGCSQMSSKAMENEKQVNRGGGGVVGGGSAGEGRGGAGGEGGVRGGEGGLRGEEGEGGVRAGVGSASDKHLSTYHPRRGPGVASRESARSTTPREVSIINIVQPIRMNNGESDDTTEVRKTSARRRNESAMIRLRYSVGGNMQRASTGVRRSGHHPEGLHKKGNSGPMVRSASVREGRLAAISREGSSYDWNLNCINIKSALHSEAAPRDRAALSNKTVEWSNEDAGRTGSRTGRKEREADSGNSDLSQPFEVVQLSPIRAKTASQQTRNTQSLEDHHHNESNDNNNTTAFGGSSEIISSAAPPPSRAATPNARSTTTTTNTTNTNTTTAMRISAHDVETSSSPRRGVVTLHVPSAAKSQASECDEDLQLERRSLEIEVDEMMKSLRRENSNGEDVERGCFEQRGPEASELGFTDTELEDTMDSVSIEGRIESQSADIV